MKKVFLTVAFLSAIGFANAQDMLSKKGTPILPEEKDWSIGFDAMPVLNYFGNLMSGYTYQNQAAIRYQTPYTLVGKMMKDANTAYRAKLRIGFGSTSIDNFANDDTYTGTGVPPKVTDTWKNSTMNITIGGGIQKYRGKGRLKGYYGAEAAVMLGSDKHTYSYGNAITSTNTSPTTSDWNAPITGGGYNTTSMSNRLTEEKSGSTFGVALRGFIGAEYFFAPKMSVGAEYGWGLNLSSTGEGSSTVESWDGTANAVKTTTSKVGGSSFFGLDVDNAAGSVYLSLYF
ncbi:MAG: hypothetical protein NT126_10045 [Bacteroidetes bacterium]|nr:hypothetical protein [Bacteroidota bacterium]